MRIIKQLSEDEFVLKMEEHDLKSYSTMQVAHDYVEFGENTGITAENDVKLLENLFIALIGLKLGIIYKSQ